MIIVMRKVSAKILSLMVSIFIFATTSLAGLNFKTIDTAKVHSMVVNNAYELEAGREKQVIIIDARTKKEYDEAHIFSSISIPENDFEKSMNLIPRDKEMILIVYSNDAKSETSQKWAEKAAAAGYLNIVIYQEGFQIWKKNKMPIASLSGI